MAAEALVDLRIDSLQRLENGNWRKVSVRGGRPRPPFARAKKCGRAPQAKQIVANWKLSQVGTNSRIGDDLKESLARVECIMREREAGLYSYRSDSIGSRFAAFHAG